MVKYPYSPRARTAGCSIRRGREVPAITPPPQQHRAVKSFYPKRLSIFTPEKASAAAAAAVHADTDGLCGGRVVYVCV